MRFRVTIRVGGAICPCEVLMKIRDISYGGSWEVEGISHLAVIYGKI
jgi:hypothetical protein